MPASIVVALVSALCFAGAAALQHAATRSIALAAPPGSAGLARWLPVLGMLSKMLGDRIWWCGLALNVLGFVLHATALHLGSITVVQALLCVQLMFALPFATARFGALPLARDWIGTAAVSLGIIMLVMTRGSVPQTLERHHLIPVVVASAMVLMAVLVVAAKAGRKSIRTAVIGTASGVGFSLTAVLTVVVAGQLLHNGWFAVLSHWHVYGLALSGLIAAILVQDAFASGSFPAALTAMIVADPLASWLWGAILFDQTPPTTPAALAGLVFSGLLIGVGVSMLAHSPTIARSQVAA
ncbi:MAG TPA: hypothetical protein DGT23_17740 [Micromonosporaceae bacterium]|nr:hypothetical protein [Micromonosporaceae bacterium]